MSGRTKEIERHLPASEIDERINDAQKADEPRLVRRLCCIKNLYAGDTLEEAAWRVGVDESAVSRWSDAWNENGPEGLRPNFGGGRPTKLTERQRTHLGRVVASYPSLTVADVRRLIEAAFGVQYSERHVVRLVGPLESTGDHSNRQRNGRASEESNRSDRLEAALSEIPDELTVDGDG